MSGIRKARFSRMIRPEQPVARAAGPDPLAILGVDPDRDEPLITPAASTMPRAA